MTSEGKRKADWREAERRRVDAILRRDRQDREDDERREDARIAFENGDHRARQDGVLGPTPEQLRSGMWDDYEIDKHDRSSANAKTLRRVSTPIVLRMHRRGALDEEQAAACFLYRSLFEKAGYYGRVGSRNPYSEIYSRPQHFSLITDRQFEAMDDFQFIRKGMTARFLPFFEAVVLSDAPLRRAALGRQSGRHPMATMRRMADLAVERIAALEKKD